MQLWIQRLLEILVRFCTISSPVTGRDGKDMHNKSEQDAYHHEKDRWTAPGRWGSSCSCHWTKAL